MSSGGIQVKKVEKGRGMNDFIALPQMLYRDNDLYVPDMESELRGFFDEKKNSSLEFADIQPFVAYKDGKAVGRITAIISHKSNAQWDKKYVRFSHIEFIDDIEVSRALIRTVEQWGRERGMNDIQGPMGITDFDKEGMLVEDFELGGTFMEIWNPSYYVTHMEQLGFAKEADWLQVRVKVPEVTPPRYARVAEYTREEFGLKVLTKTRKEMTDGYVVKIFHLLNQAYAPLFGFAPFSEKQIADFARLYVQLLDMSLVPVIEDANGELACVAVTVKDFSIGMQKSKGRMLPFGWYHLLKALKWQKHDKAQLMIIAVRPDMQGLGVNALIFDHLIPVYNKLGIKWCETGPQLETNVKELSQWKPLNPELVKRRRCWCKKIEG